MYKCPCIRCHEQTRYHKSLSHFSSELIRLSFNKRELSSSTASSLIINDLGFPVLQEERQKNKN